jgi:hypothetical protein
MRPAHSPMTQSATTHYKTIASALKKKITSRFCHSALIIVHPQSTRTSTTPQATTMDASTRSPAARNNAQNFLNTLDELECIICDEPFNETHPPVIIRSCHHLFGSRCLRTWVLSSNRNHNRCPICRGVLFDDGLALVEEIQEALSAARATFGGLPGLSHPDVPLLHHTPLPSWINAGGQPLPEGFDLLGSERFNPGGSSAVPTSRTGAPGGRFQSPMPRRGHMSTHHSPDLVSRIPSRLAEPQHASRTLEDIYRQLAEIRPSGSTIGSMEAQPSRDLPSRQREPSHQNSPSGARRAYELHYNRPYPEFQEPESVIGLPDGTFTNNRIAWEAERRRRGAGN